MALGKYKVAKCMSWAQAPFSISWLLKKLLTVTIVCDGQSLMILLCWGNRRVSGNKASGCLSGA